MSERREARAATAGSSNAGAEACASSKKNAEIDSGMSLNAEIDVMGLYIPWWMVIGVLAYLAAWLCVALLERAQLTCRVWHLPLFFPRTVGAFLLVIGFALRSMKKALPYTITLLAVVLAVLCAMLLYHRYQSHPWTRDGQVRANIVGIAPRVAGPIISIPIRTTRSSKRATSSSRSILRPTRPRWTMPPRSSSRPRRRRSRPSRIWRGQTDLYKTNVVGQEAYQDAQDQYYSATANVAAAQAQLETAKLNLSYTKVVAPVDGYLTNVNTSPGTYVNEGEQLLALVDKTSFWVAGYFKETQISHVQPGDKARITLMGHSGRHSKASWESTGWAISLQDGATVQLIPQVAQTIDWVRLPQRFPVRIQIKGKSPVPCASPDGLDLHSGQVRPPVSYLSGRDARDCLVRRGGGFLLRRGAVINDECIAFASHVVIVAGSGPPAAAGG